MKTFLLTCSAKWAISAASVFVFICKTQVVDAAPCPAEAPCGTVVAYPENEEPSWVFRHGTYTHDPVSGARVARYMRTPPVEALDDERLVTSRYRRSRTNLRGANGSIDTYYEVQAWGNGRGGIDAEWERFHDAWKESYLQNGYYNQNPGFGAPWGYGQPGYGNGYPGYGYGGPGYGGQFPPNGSGWNGHHGGNNHGHGGHDGDDD